jgi:hypothetical protein
MVEARVRWLDVTAQASRQANIPTPLRMRSVLPRSQSKRGQLGLMVLAIQKLGNRAVGNRAHVDRVLLKSTEVLRVRPTRAQLG